MFAGQLGCEALNFALKRIIKEERPKRMYQENYLLWNLGLIERLYRNVWKRLWHAFLTRAIRLLLRRLHGPLPPISTVFEPRQPGTDFPSYSLSGNSTRCYCGGRQPYLPDLPYPPPSPRRLRCWGGVRSSLVPVYGAPAKLRLD
jgi:hypothetical protein